jgi:ribonuclease BN (tRNA processing enzyme)
MNTFQFQLLDEKIGEPGLLLHHHGVGVLFDAPFLLFERKIKTSTLHRLECILLTHRHRDHFGGIDRLFFEVSPFPFVVGNQGTRAAVQQRLHSYDINLIEPDTIRGHEVLSHEDPIVVFEHKRFHIEAIALDHGNIHSISYAFQEHSRIKLNKVKLTQSPYTSGAWVRTVKLALEEDKHPKTVLVENKETSFEVLKELFYVQEGLRVVYASDFDISEANQDKLVKFAHRADHFFCEAAYLNEDLPYAIKNNHQTVGEAAQIALKAEVASLHLFHHSRRYQRTPDAIDEFIRQAQQIFPNVS